MRKLLTILGAVGLTATTGAAVVACGNDKLAEKSDFIVLAHDLNMHKGETSKLTIQDYDTVGKTLEDFKVVLNEEQQKTLTITFANGVAVVTAGEAGTVKFKVEATEKVGPQEVVKKYSQEVTITVTKFSLNDIKIAGLANIEVTNNKKLTEEEANNAQTSIRNYVNSEIIKTVKEAKLDTDYTIDLTKVVKDADASEGLTIEVKAKADSEWITADSKTSIKVTFKNKTV